MSDTLAGSGSYVYGGTSSTYKSGDRAVDTHLPFNPMIKSPDLPESMRYVIEKITTFEKTYPNIEYDAELGEGTVRFRCQFRDPLWMDKFFSYKGVTTTWTGTGDQLTYNFSVRTNIDNNIWVQVHVHDQSGNGNHLNFFLDGGKMISYKWILEVGKPIIEEFEIKFAKIIVNSEYPPDITDGFDDASFNLTGVKEVCTIVAVAASAITTNTYFTIQAISSAWLRTNYHVWFNKDAGGVDPAPTGSTAIEVAVTTGDADTVIATAIGAALDAASDDFGTPGVVSATVTVTINTKGDVKDAVDVDSGCTIAVTTQGAVDIDGGWSNWDGAYTSKQCAMVVDTTVTFNSLSVGDLGATSLELEFINPWETYRVMTSLTVANGYNGVKTPFRATLSGMALKGNDLYVQPSTVIASKTSATFKVLYGTTKYLQFTLARVEEATMGGVEAGKGAEGSLTFVGGAGSVLTYSWSADEATDPSAHITHTDL